jgi:hypothetical protein
MSLLLPAFLQKIEQCGKHILLVGCGGGFDFVHSTLLLPELKRLGKTVVFGSFSFGNPRNYTTAPTYWVDGLGVVPNDYALPALHAYEQPVLVKIVDASSRGAPDYAPEQHMVACLDEEFPEDAPHRMYAYYARSWTVDGLHAFYHHLVEKHSIDLVIAFDGGSDSLVVGDEAGLGDPIEDAVTLGAVAKLTCAKMLITVGFGADRFNQVSDCSSLRAVAELTRLGGFLGSVSIAKDGAPFALYRKVLTHIYRHQTFRSVLAGAVCTAIEGESFGFSVPPEISGRVARSQNSGLWIWPLMAMLFSFDVDVVAQRSLVVKWIQGAKTAAAQAKQFDKNRGAVAVRPIENYPLQDRWH